MAKDKFDRFIDAFRSSNHTQHRFDEEGMVANPPGGSGGFSSHTTPPGRGIKTVAGYDPVMGKMERRNPPGAPKRKRKKIQVEGRNRFVNQAINELMNRGSSQSRSN